MILKTYWHRLLRRAKRWKLNDAEFEEKIKIIEEKLASGISSMDEATRANLLSDLTRLEMILDQNEKLFYKNQNDYRDIFNALKEKYFDLSELENKLSQSEAQRLKTSVPSGKNCS